MINILKSFIFRIIYPKQSRIRLRHVLFLGSIMEQQAEAFYRHLAMRANDSDVKLLCQELADDEIKHLNLIKGMLYRWQRVPINENDLENIGVLMAGCESFSYHLRVRMQLNAK